MPELSISETQREALEEIREDLEAAYVGEYGTVRTADAIQYLLDTYTPPETADAGRSTADGETLVAIDGIGEATAESLADAGIRSVADVAAADPGTIAEIDGIGDGQAVDIVASATEIEAERAEGDDTEGGGTEPDAPEADDSEAAADPGSDREEAESPEDTLQQAMSLLDAHGERWREADGDEPYEVDLPDGSTEAVRTKDDVRRLLFKHWK